MTPVKTGSIAVLDFGGQYAHLLARRVRECGAYSVLCPPETPVGEMRGAAGIILSGGPQSVYDPGSPRADPGIFELGVPMLGICYGHQWIAHVLGGKVQRGVTKEYGRMNVRKMSAVCKVGMAGTGDAESWKQCGLLEKCPEEFVVWMSHGDVVTELPMGFRCVASSEHCTVAIMADERRRTFGLQFHPEVTHTECGQTILQNFVHLCDASPWFPADALVDIEQRVREEVGDRNVFMLVSGGVDSTVAFTLLNRVLGPERVRGLFIDTGLMRTGEVPAVQKSLTGLGYHNLHVEDASDEFFAALAGVCDPEEKRQSIGNMFIEVQRRVFEKFISTTYNLQPTTWLLGQGTIYPDTIETGGTMHADHIKMHHNRIPAIQAMIDAGRVIEPLKELYKDEVRRLGEELGLSQELVWRHPFPGPGLGVRILCVRVHGHVMVSSSNHDTVPSFDGLRMTPHMVLPVRSVGVQGDGRTYRHAVALFSDDPFRVCEEHRRLARDIPNRDARFNRVLFCTSHSAPPSLRCTPTRVTRATADLLREADVMVQDAVHRHGLSAAIWQFPVVLLPFGTRPSGRSIVLRPVTSLEAMTAEAFHLPPPFLEEVTRSLLHVVGIDMVFYDLTSKPPATIEWE